MQYYECRIPTRSLQELPPIAQPEKRSLSDLARWIIRRRVRYRQRKRLEALKALDDLRQRFGSRAGFQNGVGLEKGLGAESEPDESGRFPQ